MSIFKNRGSFQGTHWKMPIESGRPTGGTPAGLDSSVVPPTHTPTIPAAGNDLFR